MFGSKLQETARAAGQEAVIYSDVDHLEQITDVVELVLLDAVSIGTDAKVLEQLSAWSKSLPVLAVYSHVDVDSQLALKKAGCVCVVPRSRVVREGVQIIQDLLNDRSKK